MKYLAVLVCVAGLVLQAGCTSVVRNQKVVSTSTVFFRNAEGKVKSVEIQKTSGAFYIGPDGKVFMSRPTIETLRKHYGN